MTLRVFPYTPRLRIVANARNIIIIPMARPIPYTGVKSANVADIETRPAEAAVPTVLIPAKTGITMKRTSNARAAYSGRVIISSPKQSPH